MGTAARAIIGSRRILPHVCFRNIVSDGAVWVMDCLDFQEYELFLINFHNQMQSVRADSVSMMNNTIG